MHFTKILEHNKKFVLGRARRPLPSLNPIPLVVLACYDPRLDPLLRPALGLAESDALILRAPGAAVQPGSTTLRHLYVALHMFDSEEVLVVGHTSCRMADFDTTGFIDGFRKRGIPREAFGAEDLRAWAGAIPDPRGGVIASIAAITAAPFMPRSLRVGGLVLDDETGSLEVVLRPGEAVPAGAAKPAGPAKPADGAPVAAPPRPPAPPRAAAPQAGDTARELVRMLASAKDWQEDLHRLRSDLARQRNPLLALALLENFIGRTTSQSHDVAEVYRRLKREVAGGGGGRAGSGAVLEVLRRVIEEEGGPR